MTVFTWMATDNVLWVMEAHVREVLSAQTSEKKLPILLIKSTYEVHTTEILFSWLMNLEEKAT